MFVQIFQDGARKLSSKALLGFIGVVGGWAIYIKS